MRVQVIVPFRGGCPYRERAWGWVREHYTEGHPDWKVVEALAPEGEWCKALAVNPAVEASGADIIVQGDADCWTDGLGDAVAAVEAGAGWSIPHLKVHRLSEMGTAAVLDEGKDWREIVGGPHLKGDRYYDQRPYPGVFGGGFVVASRGVLREVSVDPRFLGWGNEDESHAMALTALFGKPWRGTADLVHCWHPPADRLTRRRGSRESWALRQRYSAARRDPDAIRALLEEARWPLPA